MVDDGIENWVLSRSKVLINLVGGSRLMHNIHHFYSLIQRNGYCYVAGSLLKNVIEQLEYDEFKSELKGLRISRQKVRLVSNGLTARLFLVPKEVPNLGGFIRQGRRIQEEI